ncbi:hypothetical protein KUV89_09040 [Marinobacter hydrocarbonoclasticus]|nr:hypothetical protein [Marinobacter nauticus]
MADNDRNVIALTQSYPEPSKAAEFLPAKQDAAEVAVQNQHLNKMLQTAPLC